MEMKYKKIIFTGICVLLLANDPSSKNTIVSFLDYKWIDKSEIEVILDEKNLRDIKLNEILK